MTARAAHVPPGRSVNHSALAGSVQLYLRLQPGCWVLKVLGGLGQRPGVPDVLACLGGRLIAAECKTGRGDLTAPQRAERAALERAGALYIEVRSLDDLEAALVAAGLVRPALQG